MKRILTFLGVVVLLALPVVALAQAAPTSTSAAPVTFVSDPIGYLQAHYEAIYAALFSVFIIARVVIRYVTVPKSGTLWAALYNFILHASLPTPKLATPLGKVATAITAAAGGDAPPPTAPPPAAPAAA